MDLRATRVRSHDDVTPADLEASRIDLRKLSLSAVARLFIILFQFGRSFVVEAARKVSGPRRRAGWDEVAARATRVAFARLGPTFVKLGQLIASSPGVFPKVLADECRVLLEGVPPFPYAEVRAIVEGELGDALEGLFESFEEKPIAAASIAQVHGCVLRDGRQAVVKVQRPNLRGTIDDDLRLQYRLAKLIDRTERGHAVNPVGLIEDLNRSLHEELNFFLEADHQHVFGERIGAYGDNDQVGAPAIYWDYCSPRVLCMERIFGTPFDEITPEKAKECDLPLLLRCAVKVWMEAAFHHGLFHADVHAGNIFLLEDGHICFHDFGVVGELEPPLRRAMLAAYRASALDQDWVGFVEAWREAGLLPADGTPAEKAAATVSAAYEPVIDQELGDISLGKVIMSQLEMLQELGAQVDKGLLLCIKQVMYFERYGKQLAPEWKLAKDLYLLKNLLPDLVAAKAAAEGVTLPH